MLSKINRKQVGMYLGLTFGLTWLLNLVMYLTGGLANPIAILMLQFQMLIPAFCALILGRFFFSDSPIYVKNRQTAARWFIYYYFGLVLVYLTGIVISMRVPALLNTIAALLLIPSVIGLILLVILRRIGGKETFSAIGMGGGKPKVWLGLGLALAAFYGIGALLNYVLRLGTVPDIAAFVPQIAESGLPVYVVTLSMAFNSLLIGPFLGLIITFGEEYGWRGFLQNKLAPLGRIPGTALLGIIWGIWHWPVIWMGYNYPGTPVLGSVLMVVMCVELAYFLAYAVFKAKGLWVAAFLHALNNQTLSFVTIAVIKPNNLIFSFGSGIFGLALGAAAVAWILRDPVWRERK